MEKNNINVFDTFYLNSTVITLKGRKLPLKETMRNVINSTKKSSTKEIEDPRKAGDIIKQFKMEEGEVSEKQWKGK